MAASSSRDANSSMVISCSWIKAVAPSFFPLSNQCAAMKSIVANRHYPRGFTKSRADNMLHPKSPPFVGFPRTIGCARTRQFPTRWSARHLMSLTAAKASTEANTLSKADLGCNGGVYCPDHLMSPFHSSLYETRNSQSAMPICGAELA